MFSGAFGRQRRGVGSLQVLSSLQRGYNVFLVEGSITVPVAFGERGRLAGQVFSALQDSDDI